MNGLTLEPRGRGPEEESKGKQRGKEKSEEKGKESGGLKPLLHLRHAKNKRVGVFEVRGKDFGGGGADVLSSV
jgi:hypothetical protein